MQPLRPCARCEQEMPEAFFEGKNAVFCNHCAAEVNEILSKKYSVIEAAHFRAQLRLSSKNVKKQLKTQAINAVNAVGD